MKKMYNKPMAEKLVFNYTDNIVASDTSTVISHGDIGIGVGHGGGCDHEPGHGDPHKPHPVFPDGKP